MDFDFEQATTELEESTEKTFDDVAFMVNKLAALEGEISSLEDVLKERKEEHRRLTEEALPSTMDAANCLEFRYKDGRRVVINDTVNASIAKANEAEAYSWLEENGHEDLIKRKLELSIGRGENDLAEDVKKDIKDLFGLDMNDKASVHAATLKAWAKEQLEKGIEIPEKLFGIYKVRKAVFKTR